MVLNLFKSSATPSASASATTSESVSEGERGECEVGDNGETREEVNETADAVKTKATEVSDIAGKPKHPLEKLANK